MNKIVVGQFVSPEESILDKRFSQAGNNYVLKLIEFLDPKIAIILFPMFIRSSEINPVNTGKFVRIYRKTKLPYKLHSICRLIFNKG
jgi:hypothetical protein